MPRLDDPDLYESETDDEHVFDDEIDLREIQRSATSLPIVANRRNYSKTPYTKPQTTMKDIEYYACFLGIILNFVMVVFYGYQIYRLVATDLPDITQDKLPVRGFLRFRYVGAFLYFCACFYPKYVYQCRNAEAPVVITTVMQIYYELNNKTAATVFHLSWPVLVAIACILRRNRILRSIMNPWSKDPFEFQRLKRDMTTIWRTIKTFGCKSDEDLF